MPLLTRRVKNYLDTEIVASVLIYVGIVLYVEKLQMRAFRIICPRYPARGGLCA